MVSVGEVFKTLADPTRRAILDKLFEREDQTLFEICSRLISKHDVASSRPAVSHHLVVLQDAGLVKTRRVGRYKFHRLDQQPLERLTDRWLTVVSPAAPDGVELLLEPDEHPAAKAFKAALVQDGIPATSFGVDDMEAEYERLCGLGVRFTQKPTGMGLVITAVLDDTCGNLIQIAQQTP